MMPKRAFTLIELLIVVAIIAILAAIAVPNFLTAQIRAKIARVESDFHTFFLAVESYRIDNNLGKLTDLEAALHFHTANQHSRLTTPVAYMSHQLVDPFARYPEPVYDCGSGVTNWANYMFGLYHFEPLGNSIYGWPPAGTQLAVKMMRAGRQYMTLSIAPDRRLDAACGIYYDISNGIMSYGDLMAWGPM
ncbi:prepilin-type N-terminal cleavage/methylation domain-containing protein [bacterium]|nr:prepilin-type N-terminal cleavage/methylation domain-containing protein [bacterium]